MCSRLSVPAACVKDLSARLAKYFNIKSVSAFALTRHVTFNTNIEINEEIRQKASEIIADLAQKIVPLLPSIKNPFDFKIQNVTTNISTTPVDIELEKRETEETPKATEPKIELCGEEAMETFGSDFISFENLSTNKTIGFDSNKFILFADEFSDNESNPDDITENNPTFDSFNTLRKRKLTATVQKCNDEAEFNQFSVRYRGSNQNRDKTGKKKQANKKNQLMNEMQNNRFKNTKDSSLINKKNKNKT